MQHNRKYYRGVIGFSLLGCAIGAVASIVQDSLGVKFLAPVSLIVVVLLWSTVWQPRLIQRSKASSGDCEETGSDSQTTSQR